MGKVIYKEIVGESQTIIEFESYQDFKDWYRIGSEDVASVSDTQFNISKSKYFKGYQPVIGKPSNPPKDE